MKIEKRKIEELKAAEYNPRKDLKPGDAEYEKLKRSIQEFGYVEPVIWNQRTGNVVGGHQRLKVLKDLGQTEIDCVIVDLDDAKEKALNIALNKISGEWDNDLLAALLKDLDGQGYDVTLTGFDLAEAQELFGAVAWKTYTKTILMQIPPWRKSLNPRRREGTYGYSVSIVCCAETVRKLKTLARCWTGSMRILW